MEIATGLVGAIVGGAITFIVQRLEWRRVSRLDRTFELYRHWQSPQILSARVQAAVALDANDNSTPSRTFLQLYQDLQAKGALQDWLAIQTTFHFFDECNAVYQANAINRSLFACLFRRHLNYWIDGRIMPLWNISANIDDLRELQWYEGIAERVPQWVAI